MSVPWKNICSYEKHSLLRFINCRILRDSDWHSVDLWVKDGLILNPEPIFFVEKRTADIQIDCAGYCIIPGYIDVQINGAFGVDFSSPEGLKENIGNVRRGLLKYGVTAFCPTIISSSPATYRQIIPQIDRCEGGSDGAAILGLHLEGPFISEDQHGCHPIENVCHNICEGVKSLEQMYTKDGLDKAIIFTIAPELPNALETIKALTTNYNIKVSLGHSGADLSDGEAAFNSGACCVTHLFNAMNTFHHRDPGLVGLLTSKYIRHLPLHYGLIADGIHTHDSALRIAHKTHPQGLVLVTDAMAALGLGEGAHSLGDLSVHVTNRRATVTGSDLLAGSVTSLDQCVRHLVHASHCAPVEAVECASLHPASFLSLQNIRGTLNFGARADFLIVDSELNVLATFIAGHKVWCSQS